MEEEGVKRNQIHTDRQTHSQKHMDIRISIWTLESGILSEVVGFAQAIELGLKNCSRQFYQDLMGQRDPAHIYS